MDAQNEAMELYPRLVEDAVRRRAWGAGLGCTDAEECVAEFHKRHLLCGDRGCFGVVRDVESRRVQREVKWFVRCWIRDRTVRIEPACGEPGAELAVLRNVDLETIAEIVSTFSVSARWLWRRVELEGARLKDLESEIGTPADVLNRDLYQIKRRIRRVLDAGE